MRNEEDLSLWTHSGGTVCAKPQSCGQKRSRVGMARPAPEVLGAGPWAVATVQRDPTEVDCGSHSQWDEDL